MSEWVIGPVGRDRASVPELWEAQVGAGPDRPFLRFAGREWTYAEAWAEIGAMAELLRDRGVAPGGRVASFLSNRPEALWTWFGTQLAGAAHVALNREHRGELLADMLHRSGAAVLVTERAAVADLPADAAQPALLVEELDLAPCTPAPGAGAAAARPADLGAVLYTSGTTGRSKAVLISHNHLARGGARFAASIGQRPDDRWHAWMPMSHIFGQLHVTMATVAAGGSLALHPRLSTSGFWREVAEDRCTIFGGLGNMLRMLWHAAGDEHRDNTLRVGLIATPPPELRDPFRERFGVELVDSYGMTEAEPVTLPAPGTPAGSCGAENPDFELAVLDDDGVRVADGGLGELAIRPRAPDVMFRGYEGDEAATVAAWRDLWFHTGDVGRRDADGFYYLADRRRHVIRTRGENVSPSELEALIRAHPGVRDCGVVGVPSAHVDDDVKAVVVVGDGETLAPAELHGWCAGRMAGFMVPRHIELRTELPYSTLGKLDRDGLLEPGGPVWSAP